MSLVPTTLFKLMNTDQESGFHQHVFNKQFVSQEFPPSNFIAFPTLGNRPPGPTFAEEAPTVSKSGRDSLGMDLNGVEIPFLYFLRQVFGTAFSRMRSEGFPFIVGVWGWTCVRVVLVVSSSPRRRQLVNSLIHCHWGELPEVFWKICSAV